MCRKHWWWFVISIIVCVGVAYVQYKRSVQIYEREALVLVINDQSAGGGTDASVLTALGLPSVSSNVTNELRSITSPANMMEVTRRLELNVSYARLGGWHPIPLWGASNPVNFSFPGWDGNRGLYVKGVIMPGNRIKIEKISGTARGEARTFDDLDLVFNYTNGAKITTPVGDFVITANTGYTGKVTDDFEFSMSRTAEYPTAMSLAGRLEGKITDDYSDILSLKITDSSPERAVAIINAVISVYNENWTRDRAAVAQTTSNFINDRLRVIEQELSGVDSEIAGYKSSHLIPDVGEVSSIYVQQANRAAEQLGDLTNRLAMTRYVRDFMSAASNSTSLLPANTGINNGNIEGQIAEYNTMLMQRNSLAANSSTSNPLVADLDVKLEGLRRALLQSLDNQIAALNTSISSAQRSEAVSTGKIASSPGQARNLLSFERQQKVKESLYLYLLQKREENELSQTFVAHKIRVISPPMGAPGPIAPVRNKMLMMALAIGVFLPIALIFLRELTNTRVRNRKDLESLKMPFLGELPAMRGHSGRVYALKKYVNPHASKPMGIVVEKDNLDVINESFRVLRTNLELMARRTDTGLATVVALTSLYPGSGKTFISMNLSTALAIKGRRVLVMDMDLRRATLTEILLGSHNHHQGLVEYLVGMPDATPESIRVRNLNGVEGLDLLPSGIIPPNPSELLAEPKLGELMDQLRSEYDYIIFDCPPVEIVADALIVNSLVDMTLFVIRAGLFHRSQLALIQEMYDTKRYRSLSIILNGAPDDNDGYGYGYRYGYRYGYYSRRRYGKDPDGSSGHRHRHHRKK